MLSGIVGLEQANDEWKISTSSLLFNKQFENKNKSNHRLEYQTEWFMTFIERGLAFAKNYPYFILRWCCIFLLRSINGCSHIVDVLFARIRTTLLLLSFRSSNLMNICCCPCLDMFPRGTLNSKVFKIIDPMLKLTHNFYLMFPLCGLPGCLLLSHDPRLPSDHKIENTYS